MKKSAIRPFAAFGHNTALYVVAHARAQRRRGRGPSEGYKHERNPRKALSLAFSELSRYVPFGGEHLHSAAAQTARIVKITQRPCIMLFSGNAIAANVGDDAERIISAYSAEGRRREAAYLASPAWQRDQQEALEDVQRRQAKMDMLMLRLPSLDFKDYASLIDWLGEHQETDAVGVDFSWHEIVDTFARYGFAPGMNCGNAFNSEDEANYAGYIIGNALANLAGDAHTIRQTYHDFADKWREKFHSKAA